MLSVPVRRSLRVQRAGVKLVFVPACVSVAMLSACSQLPSAGPSTKEVIDQATSNGIPQFQLVDVTKHVVDTLRSQPEASFSSRFGQDGRPPELTIARGDAVEISIWETGGTTLFGQTMTVNGIPSGSRPATIPAQIVGRDGKISVPFDGRVQAAGRTPFEVEREIQNSLQGKAAEPQVIVTVTRSIANAVTVSGEVINGTRVPLTPYGERLLDVIAAAGGSHAAIYETFVKLSRKGVTVTIPMERLVDDPAENIYAWPGDVLTLVRTPQFIEAFGATGKDAEIPLSAENVSLVQALAKSSGLLDERADPAGVFLFRYEPPALVGAMTQTPVPADQSGAVPVVYHLDLSDAKSYFLAQRFPIEDKDILYVASANANTVEKFLGLLGALTNPIVTGIIIQNQAQ
jgi:polysaccharide export outer membrane protein